MKKIGFFGGSFDPVHFGHLQMAKKIKKLKGLDEVWFSPARISPFKLETKPESIQYRMRMLQLAIQNEQGYQIYREEAKREGPSFTIDTVRLLIRIPDCQFYLLMSDESVSGFFHWKQAEEIVSLLPLLIGSRLGSSPPSEGNPKICSAMRKGWTPTDPIAISSTEIRRLLKEGGDCTAYVPKNVLDFIYQNHLYSSL